MSDQTTNTANPDAIVPVPAPLSRRAWECALDLGQEHSAAIASEAVWHWLQAVVVTRHPLALTWAECGALFRLHRTVRGVRV